DHQPEEREYRGLERADARRRRRSVAGDGALADPAADSERGEDASKQDAGNDAAYDGGVDDFEHGFSQPFLILVASSSFYSFYHCGKVAEREGFEPPVPSRVQQISSLPQSTTLPSLRGPNRANFIRGALR